MPPRIVVVGSYDNTVYALSAPVRGPKDWPMYGGNLARTGKMPGPKKSQVEKRAP